MYDFTPEKTQLLKEANTRMNLDELKTPNIIFIYCPPKIGSTTLVSSIRICSTFKYTVLHIHDEIMLKILTGVTGVTIQEIIYYNKILGRNIIVIDVYRTPIERKMSEFFDKVASFHFNNNENKLLNYNIQRLVSRFNNIFSYLSTSDYYQEKYNISIPQQFDFNNKYLLSEKDGIRYLKLRLCDSTEWSNILTSVLETKIIIFTDYETKYQTLGPLYEKFKQEYRIPANYLRQIKECKYLNYYYSPEEKKSYIEKWLQKEACDCTWSGYSDSEYAIYNNICIENQWRKDVQTEHYLDTGCRCQACTRKRKIIFLNAVSGNITREKIIHDVEVKEYTEYKKNSIKKFTEKKMDESRIPRQIPSSIKKFKSGLHVNSSSNETTLDQSTLPKQNVRPAGSFKNGLMKNVYETKISPW